MKFDGETYYPASLIASVLSARALALCAGQDGRNPDPALVGALSELAHIAGDLGLVDLAGRLDKLSNIASQGNTRDLERAAIVCLSEVQ